MRRRGAERPRGRSGWTIGAALNLIGSLIKCLSLAFLLPAAIAVGYGEPVWPFLVAGAATGGVGTALVAVTDGRERDRRAARATWWCPLLWFCVAVLGALPYLLAEPQLSRPRRRAVRVDVGVLDDGGERR